MIAGKRFRRQSKLLHQVAKACRPMQKYFSSLMMNSDAVACRQENDSLQPQLDFPIVEDCGLFVG